MEALAETDGGSAETDGGSAETDGAQRRQMQAELRQIEAHLRQMEAQQRQMEAQQKQMEDLIDRLAPSLGSSTSISCKHTQIHSFLSHFRIVERLLGKVPYLCFC